MKAMTLFVTVLLAAAPLCDSIYANSAFSIDNSAPTTSGAIINITPDNVQEVLDTYPFLVIDVYADWCMPCQMFAPTFKEVSGQLGDTYQFAKLDAGTYRDVTDQFNISGLPTVLFLKDGKEVGRRAGRLSKSEFVSSIEQAFSK